MADSCRMEMVMEAGKEERLKKKMGSLNLWEKRFLVRRKVKEGQEKKDFPSFSENKSVRIFG